jgi:hypothetical protein
MTTLGKNDIINNWSYDIYVAYSAKSPVAGDADIWKVAKVPPNMEMDTVDADYIRAAAAGTSIVYRERRPITLQTIFTAPAPEWIKIRQFSTVHVAKDDADAKKGVLRHNSSLGSPAKALDEAAKYEKGRHLLGSKETRGIDAVKAAIKEWEAIIAANQLSADSHKKGWLTR